MRRRDFLEDPAPQQSDAWRLARLGRLTGSSAAAMLATVKKGEAADRIHLRRRLVAERLTGIPVDQVDVRSKDMQRGVDREAQARAAYEGHTRQIVRPSGFLRHVELHAGCSPDGYVGNYDGIIEVKCPKSTTHLDYLRGYVPTEYLPQMMHNLWMTGAEWCDFVSFDDRFIDPALQLFVIRVPRATINFDIYDGKVRAFLAEIDAEIDAIRTQFHLADTLRASLAVAS